MTQQKRCFPRPRPMPAFGCRVTNIFLFPPPFKPVRAGWRMSFRHYLLSTDGEFNRERIPERQPHRRARAFRSFETTQDWRALQGEDFSAGPQNVTVAMRFVDSSRARGSPAPGAIARVLRQMYTKRQFRQWSETTRRSSSFADPVENYQHFIRSQKRRPTTTCASHDMRGISGRCRPKAAHQVGPI